MGAFHAPPRLQVAHVHLTCSPDNHQGETEVNYDKNKIKEQKGIKVNKVKMDYTSKY